MTHFQIWLVEDDEAQSDLFSLVARGVNPDVPVEVFDSGKELLEEAALFVREGTLPRVLVLCDLQLADMSGLDLFTELKKIPKFAQTPFIIFSGSTESENVESGYALGITAYLEKPDSLEEFKDLVTSIIGFWSRVIC